MVLSGFLKLNFKLQLKASALAFLISLSLIPVHVSAVTVEKSALGQCQVNTPAPVNADGTTQPYAFNDLYSAGCCKLIETKTLDEYIKSALSDKQLMGAIDGIVFVAGLATGFGEVAGIAKLPKVIEAFTLGADIGVKIAGTKDARYSENDLDTFISLEQTVEANSIYRSYACAWDQNASTTTAIKTYRPKFVSYFIPDTVIIKNKAPIIKRGAVSGVSGTSPWTTTLRVRAADAETSTNRLTCLAALVPSDSYDSWLSQITIAEILKTAIKQWPCTVSTKITVNSTGTYDLAVTAIDKGAKALHFFVGANYFPNGKPYVNADLKSISPFWTIELKGNGTATAAVQPPAASPASPTTCPVVPVAAKLAAEVPAQSINGRSVNWQLRTSADDPAQCRAAASFNDIAYYPAVVMYKIGSKSTVTIPNDGHMISICWSGKWLVAAGGRNDPDNPTVLLIDTTTGNVVAHEESSWAPAGHSWSDFFEHVTCSGNTVTAKDDDNGVTKTYQLPQ